MARRETRSKTVAASTTAAPAGSALKKNLSKKKTPKIAAKNEEKINKENTPDHSILQLPINLGSDNIRQILNIIKGGTTEIKDLVLNECTIIVECLECRNLFRSLANFVSHKGIYCKAHHCEKMLLFQSNSHYHNEIKEPVMQKDENDHSADLHPNSTQPSEVIQSDTANIDRQSSDLKQVTINCKYLLPTAASKRKESEVLSHNSLLPKKRKNLNAIVDELNFKANIQPLESSTEIIKNDEVVNKKCDIKVSGDKTAASTASNCKNFSLLVDETPGNAFYIENLSAIKRKFERYLQFGKQKKINMSHFICPVCGPPSMWGNFKRHLVDNNHLSEEDASLWLYYKLKYKSPKETKVIESTNQTQVTEEVEAASLSDSCPEIDADKDSGLGRCSPEMNEESSANDKVSSLSTDSIASNLKQANPEIKATFASFVSGNPQQFQSKRSSSRVKRKKCLYNFHDCPIASCLKHSKSIPIEQSSLLQKSFDFLSIQTPKATVEVDTKKSLHSESHSNESTLSDGYLHFKKSKCENESNYDVLSATTSISELNSEFSSNISCPSSTATTEKIVTKISVKSGREITIANLQTETSSNSTTDSSTSESNNSSTEDHTKTSKFDFGLKTYSVMYFCF